MSVNVNETFSLHGKVFLITGGTRGIGKAISVRFARAGAKVIVNYLRNEEQAGKLKAIAAEEGLDIMLCRADLTTNRGMEQLGICLDQADSLIAGLVHCAATGIHHRLEELTERHFDWTLNLNVKVFFRLVKTLLPRFEKGSSIVAVSSWGASRALPYYSFVGASKGALESLARHLAAELAPRGIRVNILTAGAVQTDVWKAIPDSVARLASTEQRTPLGRLVTAEEVAFGAQFLCSAEASGIVGQTLIIDGGAGIVA
jgi:NAD(P)-dependent dehydrogenase (short-subunit alcohol dehydrogenase family)